MGTSQRIKANDKLVDKVIPFIPEGDFYFTKGVEAFQKRKFEIALKWLRKAVETAPDEALFHCQMSIVYTEIGAFHAANQVLTEVLAQNGEDYVDCYYLIANNYAHLGLLQDARKYTEAYLAKAPDGDFREEAETLLEFLELDEGEEAWTFEEEDELLIYQESTFYHMERQEWEDALQLLEEMMALFPAHVSARHDYTAALFNSGQQEEALRLETGWLEKEPQSLFSHTNLAVFYHQLQDPEKRELHLRAVEKVYPIHEQQKLRIAATLARTGRYQQAAERFKSLSRSVLKGHSSYYKWFSIAAYRTGELSRALSLWEEGCRRHPHLSECEGPWADI